MPRAVSGGSANVRAEKGVALKRVVTLVLVGLGMVGVM